MTILGWDIGGAHVKVARVDPTGTLNGVALQTCQLWRGTAALRETLLRVSARVLPDNASVSVHALTMSGEMVDHFADRSTGVAEIVGCLKGCVGKTPIEVLDTTGRLRPLEHAITDVRGLASANWCAVPAWLAATDRTALFADLGSTTLDIIGLDAGRVRVSGHNDLVRLETGELVYVGAIRTPVFHLAQEVLVAGVRRPLIPESFADMGDVLLVTGDLPAEDITQPGLDGRERSIEAALCRLARAFGTDAGDHPAHWFREAAAELRQRLIAKIARSLGRRRLELGFGPEVPVITAGVGRRLLSVATADRGWPMIDLADELRAVSVDDDVAQAAAVSAPAAALALLSAQRAASLNTGAKTEASHAG